MNRAAFAAAWLALSSAPAFAQEGEPATTQDLDLGAIAETVANAPPTDPATLIDSRPDARPIDSRVSSVLRAHIMQCWRAPAQNHTIVTIRYDLNPDGSLRGQPRVTAHRAFEVTAEARDAITEAIRAIRACAPYPFPSDPVLAGRHDAWDELETTFWSAEPSPAFR